MSSSPVSHTNPLSFRRKVLAKNTTIFWGKGNGLVTQTSAKTEVYKQGIYFKNKYTFLGRGSHI
jgi:hypothetical protein